MLRCRHLSRVDRGAGAGRQGCWVACNSHQQGAPSLHSAQSPPTKKTFGFYKYNCYAKPEPNATVPGQTDSGTGVRVATDVKEREEAKRLNQQAVVLAAVSKRLRVKESYVEGRLKQLQLLLPDLPASLPIMDPGLAARLVAADVSSIAAALLQLKLIFPNADASKLAIREPVLVLDASVGKLRRAAAELRRLLPQMNIDRLVEENPSLLDVKALRRALQEFKRAEPSLDAQQAMSLDPWMVLRFGYGRIPNLTTALASPRIWRAGGAAGAAAAAGGEAGKAT